MRLDLLSVALRQRDPWEALDLGAALWRRHWGAIMRPWLGMTLPVLVLLGALGWALDRMWLAALLLWWLKPWFDRIPLYVLSRAVFGTVPGAMQVLRARELYRPGLPGWLSFRRLHPARALLLPVDLLEGARGARRGQRAAVLQRAVGSQAFGLMAVCLCFELAVITSVLVLVPMFLPTSYLSESARAEWSMLFTSPPMWAQWLALGIYWLALSLVEPMYVAAGFGLYLHRRTQLEAWDVELGFRRLVARARAASAVAASLLLAGVLALGAFAAPSPAWAKAEPAKEAPAIAPAQLVGESARKPDPAFQRGLARAYADPSLARTQPVTHWELRSPWEFKRKDKPDAGSPAWLEGIAFVFALISEYGLWVLAGLVLLFVLWRLPRWLPWVQRQLREEPALPEIVEEALPLAQPLPDDVPGAVGALWQAGRRRDALALLYRASVARLSDRLGMPFPPGATEADCLRRARKLDDLDARASFNEVVRTWQRAAYAQQFPEGEALSALLAGWAQRFPRGAPA